MTPKEKAEELFDKMYGADQSIYLTIRMAKQCALICADEILIQLVEGCSLWLYWQEVKKEIELI